MLAVKSAFPFQGLNIVMVYSLLMHKSTFAQINSTKEIILLGKIGLLDSPLELHLLK